MNAHQTIKAAMRGHEQWVMQTVKREGSIPQPFVPSPSISKAIHRLVEAGKLRWSDKHSGYVAIKKRKKARKFLTMRVKE